MASEKTSRQHPIEQELGERFRDGEEVAFNKFYERYSSPLKSFCRKLPGMAGQQDVSQFAEDVATDAFTNAWKYHATFTPGMKFFTWICEIAKNACILMLNEQKKKKEKGFIQEESAPDPPRGGGGEDDGGEADAFTHHSDRVIAGRHFEDLDEDWDDEGLEDGSKVRWQGDGDITRGDSVPTLTEAEQAERRAKLEAEDAEEDALQERIKEALVEGGINSFLKLCQKMFTAIQEDANHPWKYEIQAEAEEAEGELLYDLSKGLFPKHDIELGESGILTEEEIENNRKIILNSNKIYLPHPSYLSTINLVYQKHARTKLSLREVLILYWRRSPKCLIAEKLDISEDTLKTAISRIRAKFPDAKRAVGFM